MAGATASTLNALIKPEVLQEISDAVFRNSDFLPMFRQEPRAGHTVDVKVIVASNDSAQVYDEGQAPPDAGYQQVVTAAAAFKHIRVFTRITGHGRREVGATWDSPSWPGAYGGFDIENEKAKEDLVDLCNTTFMDSGIHGIDGIIDSSTNFYDLSRSTYAALKSDEISHSAALTVAGLNRLMHQTKDAPYGGRIRVLLMPPAQGRKYANLTSGKLAQPVAGDVSGGDMDDMPSFGGAKVVEIRDLTATVVYGLSDLSQWFLAIHEAAPGGIDVLPYGPSSDSKLVQLSTSMALICPTPNHQGKLTGCGTT